MAAAQNVETLRAEIVRRYESLSPRLKQVAAYVLEHPNDVGLETLAVIADRSRVQPSTIVRFAKALGYGGASDMQRLFRDEILSYAPNPSYAERIRQSNDRAGSKNKLSPHELMHEFTASNILALEHLRESARKADLDPTFLSRVERGEDRLSVRSLNRVARALGLRELAKLLGPWVKDEAEGPE